MDDTELREEVRVLLEQGKEIHALKLVRATLDCGLREAKDYVAALVKQWAPKQQVDTSVPDAVGNIVTILQKGLFLERRQVFLPWGASLTRLQRLGDPTAQSGGAILRWQDESILNGLPVSSVSTGSLMSLRGLYHLNCQPTEYAIYGDPQSGMRPEFVHLADVLGAPTEEWQGGMGYVWRLGRVEVILRVYSCNELHYSEDYHKYVEIGFADRSQDR